MFNFNVKSKYHEPLCCSVWRWSELESCLQWTMGEQLVCTRRLFFSVCTGCPPKKVSFWESKLCVCWLINPTKLPKGPCSTSFHSALTIGLVSNLLCPSWSCNVVYCVVSVNENKLYLFDLTRLDRSLSLSLSRGTWNPSWWTGEAGIHLLYCQEQERAL